MSVYVVTQDERVLRYDAPYGKNPWICKRGSEWKIFWKSCACDNCSTQEHEVLITYVFAQSIVSIGFEQPVVVAGRLLTAGEKENIVHISEWIKRAKSAPKHLRGRVAALEKIAE